MPIEISGCRSISGVVASSNAGIRFGSGAVMSTYTSRQRDRREAVPELIAAVTRALDRRFDVSLMRGAFETALSRIVPVRTVHLRENGSRWGGRGTSHSPESATLEVPGADPDSQGLLELGFDADCRLGDWDFQLLATAANLGALVLEIERSRTQLARAGLLSPSRVRRDGAAPLIGSTDVMHRLRGAIERVAATDRWVPPSLSLPIALENSRLDQTYNTPPLASVYLVADTLRWMLDQGGLDWAASRCDRSAEIVYGWAEASEYATPFVAKPSERSHTTATIDFVDSVDAKAVTDALRANGIIDTEPYRKLGRNQIRIALFPAIEPDDVAALTRCIDYVVDALS